MALIPAAPLNRADNHREMKVFSSHRGRAHVRYRVQAEESFALYSEKGTGTKGQDEENENPKEL